MKNLLPLTLASLMLVACGGESSNSSKINEDDITSSMVDEEPVDACVILENSIKASFSDASELEKTRDLVAEAVGAEHAAYLPDDCEYRFKSQDAVFDVFVDLWKVHSEYATDEALMKKVSYMNAEKAEELEGVGEKAFADTISNRIVAMRNKSIIQTGVRCAGDPQCAEGKPIVKALTNSIFDVLDK